jgi:acetyl-CoA carboxylase, biotin carboxylase subunit
LFSKVLIANRGEIAMRVIRACRLLGIKSVAIHSDVDAGALHVRFADEAVCIGPADASKSYLNIPQIIAAAEITGADAIHPGYGFLSENAKFAEVCKKCRLSFIGPTPDAMRLWGDKVSSRAVAKTYGLPLLPGTGVLADAKDAVEQAQAVGFPIILKASGGGGGRGMRIVRQVEDVARAYETASHEAMTGFKNPDVYLERFIEEPKHIEFQVLADQHGGVWTLGERECSLQRRHQKVMEESPSPSINEDQRARLGEVIRRAVLETGYTTLGTLEFLMDERGNLYFMEMNTRVQVEHPVTEMVTGVDLVEQQIRAAAGEKLSLPDTRPWSFRGHAIECRINAEDPRSFAPWPGLITEYHSPGGGGVRVDSGVYGGWRVPSCYDALIAKVITHGANRAEAIAKMRCALEEFIIGGIRTNIPLHQALLVDPEVVAGRMSTRTIERLVAKGF